MANDIFQYVLEQENEYQTGNGVRVAGNWQWKMYDHNNHTFLMKNSQFPVEQLPLGDRPNRNIIIPILNVAHRTEGFDVKHIDMFVENSTDYHKSFIARKFYSRFARKHKLDTFIDDVVESFDYGFSLVKYVDEVKPEVIQPQQIAFCDQSDILAGAFALKHTFSVSQLKEMVSRGWYADEVDFAIENAQSERMVNQQEKTINKTPSKLIEVYEVYGTFPNSWLQKGDEEYDSELSANEYSKQLHIITYIKDEKDNKNGVCLFKSKLDKEIFKVKVINPIYGRAAGRGRVEELFESQIWVNFNEIHKMNMLREASKVVHVTDDPQFTTRQNTKNLKGGEFLILDEGKTTAQLNTQPVNYQLFDNAYQSWEQHARTIGSASDPSLGLNPVSGTPLGTTQIVTQEGQGTHEYKRGKIADFIEEIHRDWILESIVNELNQGDEWLEELELDELYEIADKMSSNSANKKAKEMFFSGKVVTKEAKEMLRQTLKEEFLKGGKKRFIKALRNEFKDLPMTLKVNVAGRQKNQQQMTDKLSNVFRGIFANPQGFVQVMQIPAAAKSFNDMLEQSGLSPIDYSQFGTANMTQMASQPVQSQAAPQGALAIS